MDERPDIYAILHSEVDRTTAAILAARIEAALGWEPRRVEYVARYTVRYLSKLNLTVPIEDIIGWTPDIGDPLQWVDFTQAQHGALLAASPDPDQGDPS